MRFDLMVFDHEFRRQHPEIKSYDLRLPKTSADILVTVFQNDGTTRPVRVTGQELAAWGVFT